MMKIVYKQFIYSSHNIGCRRHRVNEQLKRHIGYNKHTYTQTHTRVMGYIYGK